MPAADLVLKNARVITMDPAHPEAGLVAISGDKILAVADNDALEAVTGHGTKVIDCEGRTVAPGLNDAHCHLFSFVRKLLSIDLGPPAITSIADIKATVRRQAEKTPKGAWISGTGINDFYLREKRLPNRWELDEAAPEHPAVVAHRSLHACVLNSLGLKLAGINTSTPEPPGGLIERDPASGEPNGILYESLGHIREKVMPPISEEDLAKNISLADREYLSCGITSIQDATVVNNLARWQTLQQSVMAGRLHTRLYMMLGAAARRQFEEAGLVSGSGDNRLRLGAVKMMLTETTGRLRPEQGELNETALDIHRAGFQLAFHAVEPTTVAAAITALEYVDRRSPVAGRRHRLEHCSECPPHLLDRLRLLQPVIATQPPFLYYSGERYLATLPADRIAWAYRFKSFFDSGLVVAGSSDSPVVPTSPLVGMYAAVTRRAATGQPILPSESVSPLQAMAMYTTNAAYASFEENTKGSITPGKLADLVVLSADPTHVPPERIKDIKVVMTIIGGRVVWEA